MTEYLSGRKYFQDNYPSLPNLHYMQYSTLANILKINEFINRIWMKNTEKMFPGWPDCLLRQQTRIINRISSNNNFVIIWSTILVTFRCLPYILANAAFFPYLLVLGGVHYECVGRMWLIMGNLPVTESRVTEGEGSHTVDMVWVDMMWIQCGQERGAIVWIRCSWCHSGGDAAR